MSVPSTFSRGERVRRAQRSAPRSRALIVVVALLSASFGVLPRDARAEPSVWARARDPEAARRAEALKAADALVHEHSEIRRNERSAGGAFRDNSKLEQARAILEEAGAATSRDPLMRYRLAEVLSDLGQHERAAEHYQLALGSASLSPPLRATGLVELAICYARMGRHGDEIKAYTEALALEPLGPIRAMILSNRAEAYMVLGDITKAIEGYRGSITSLLPIEMLSFGVTTLWGLGVALDRSGDLESGLESITLARAYDPGDKLINGPGWFYVPEYDDAWYAALGHWARARQAELGMARAEQYARAINAWESYIARAPGTDQWLALAKVRLRACEAERDATRQRIKAKSGGRVGLMRVGGSST